MGSEERARKMVALPTFSDAPRFVLLYDDELWAGRYYPPVTAIGAGTRIGKEQLERQPGRRGK